MLQEGSGGGGSAEAQHDAEMRVYEQYVVGMLTNLVFSRMLRRIRLARMLQFASRLLLPLHRWAGRAAATRRNHAATLVQTRARASVARRRWLQQKGGVVLLQKRSRGLLARNRELAGRTGLAGVSVGPEGAISPVR